MYTYEQHLENLVRHINFVRDNCMFLGKRIIADGEREFGRILIANGFVHDASKFSGIEWEFLHCGNDVPAEKVQLAIYQHVHSNSHHPEFFGSIHEMPRIAVSEMVCDWAARAAEFGTSLNGWIQDKAMQRYKFTKNDNVYKQIDIYSKMLTEGSWVKNAQLQEAV